jgi:uncharacterized coiled-coil protein SlyX
VEKSQKVSLIAVAIALFSIGLLLVNNLSLQSDLRNLNMKLSEQSDMLKSSNSDLKTNQVLIESQNEHITKLDHFISIQNESISQLGNITAIQNESIAQLQDKIRSIDNSTNSLEQKLNSLEQKLNSPVNSPKPSGSLGLVGWWSGDGHATDSTGTHPGTMSDSVTFTSGKIGLAFSLNGIDSYVSLGALGINNENNAFSITSWINPDLTTVKDNLSHRIVAEGANTTGFGNGEFFTNVSLASFHGPGAIEVQIGATQTWSQEEFTSPVITPGKWTFVAVTYDGSKTPDGIKVYVDGVKQATVSAGSGFTGTSIPRDEWSIGADSSGSNHSHFFAGGIDETKIFDCVLTSIDIQEEFHGHSVSKC